MMSEIRQTATCPPAAADRSGLPLADQPTLTESLTSPPAPLSPAPLHGWPTVAGYEILGELGRGAMGVVYKARHKALNRLVALKMILAGAHAGAEELARFRQEAEAVARVQHPNVVQVHEVGTVEDRPFFSLEFCPGGSLAHKFKGDPQPARAAAQLVQTLARAVHAAHQAGIVHRDLKPQNVLLAADGTLKVTDFGLAKLLDKEQGQTQSGAVMGTPSYMAPEQALGNAKQVGPATDVWALGAILYELLTGRPPFAGAEALETLFRVAREEPVAPSCLVPGIPRDLETICLKCLQKERRHRYGSALLLAEELGRFLKGEPVKARPVGKVVRLWRWCRRNPVLATTGALAAAFLMAGTVVSSLFALDAYRTAERLRTEETRTKLLLGRESRALKNLRREQERAELAFREVWQERDQLARLLSGEGFFAYTKGEYLKAESLFRKALINSRKHYPPAKFPQGHPVLAGDLNNLGPLLQAKGEYGQAEPFFREALAMRKQLYPKNRYPDGHPLLASSLNNLGDLLKAKGEYSQAEPFFREALAMRKQLYPAKRYPEGHPDLAVGLNNLGSLLQAQGEYGQAERFYRAALVMQKKLYPVTRYPQGHPALAVGLNNLGSLLKAKGEYGLAERFYRETLAMNRQLYPAFSFPRGHPQFAAGLNSLESVLQAKGEYGLAEPFFREALAMCQKLYPAAHFPEGHPDLAASENKLGLLLQTKGAYGLAEPFYREALAMRKKLYPAKRYPQGTPTWLPA